ncbi:TraB/GumN family protein [Sagittula sp. SSi028]|uniref:TraB/GumN family protein n=1 Tax=Sagittula sp. SSi028 TaxID=3400636 RepID=UPI003AF8FED9
MTRLFILLAALCGLATAGQAQCTGTDIRSQLTEAEQAEVAQRLAQTPYPTGNHWIATRGEERLHLIGTVHLSDDRLDGPAERLAPIIQDASLLLLEMNAEDSATLEAQIASDPSLFLLDGQSLPDLLDQADWVQLSNALEARGMPPFMGARMKPWYVSVLLSMPACMASQVAEMNGLDHRLEQIAEDAGVATASLEPYDTAIRLFAEIPMETQLSMIRAALAPSDVNEDLFETLLATYFTEDHALGQLVLEVVSPRVTPLDDAENEAVFDSMNDALLTARNTAWITALEQALADTEGTVVAAFGAAHLAGETGVLALLEAEGYALERAPF